MCRRQVVFVLGEDVQQERMREIFVAALAAGVEQPVAVVVHVEIGANHRLGAFDRPRNPLRVHVETEFAVPKPRPAEDVLPGPDTGHLIAGELYQGDAFHVARGFPVPEMEVEGQPALLEAEVENVESVLPVCRRQVVFVLGEDVQQERVREIFVTALAAGVEQPVAVVVHVETTGANNPPGVPDQPRHVVPLRQHLHANRPDGIFRQHNGIRTGTRTPSPCRRPPVLPRIRNARDPPFPVEQKDQPRLLSPIFAFLGENMHHLPIDDASDPTRLEIEVRLHSFPEPGYGLNLALRRPRRLLRPEREC